LPTANTANHSPAPATSMAMRVHDSDANPASVLCHRRSSIEARDAFCYGCQDVRTGPKCPCTTFWISTTALKETASRSCGRQHGSTHKMMPRPFGKLSQHSNVGPRGARH
jgi:hypothetical protein